VPHGVGIAFKQVVPRSWPRDADEPVRCLYVSNAAPYKHQWHVVTAIGALRRRGYNVHLNLVGGGAGRAQRRLDDAIERADPTREFVRCAGFVSPDELPEVLADAHLFVFASSCENMPNTLVEAMAAGLPIACSDRGPMPEVLADGGVYFDPESPDSISDAVERLLTDADLRASCAKRAKVLSDQYSWARCGKETWEYLLATIGR
jgi:glycosyltransferase involved in cell wall biosynthesis